MYERMREQLDLRQAEIARDARFAALRRDAELARVERSERRVGHRIPAVHVGWLIRMAQAVLSRPVGS